MGKRSEPADQNECRLPTSLADELGALRRVADELPLLSPASKRWLVEWLTAELRPVRRLFSDVLREHRDAGEES